MLHALGDDPHAEAFRQTDGAAPDRGIVWIGGDIAHKKLIYRSFADIEAFEISQIRVSGTEIINDQTKSTGSQFVPRAHCNIAFNYQRRFGKSYFHVAGLSPILVQGCRQNLQQPAAFELHCLHIDGHWEMIETRFKPATQFNGPFHGGLFADRNDQTGFFRHRNKSHWHHLTERFAAPAQQRFHTDDSPPGQ